MDNKDDFAMADFTAEKARRVTEASIPELAAEMIKDILGKVSSQAARGIYQIDIPVSNVSFNVSRTVGERLINMGYHCNLYAQELTVSWRDENSGD